MSALIHLSALPLVHALGWALLHFCWQGALTALLLACVLALLPSRAARPRYAAACAAMALMLALPLVTFARLARRPASAGAALTVPLHAAPYAPIAASPDYPAQPWLARAEDDLNRALPGIILFWIAGVALLAFRLNLGLLAVRRMKRLAVLPASPELSAMLQALATRLRIARAVRLMHSIQVEAPAVIGWLRPMILIPVGCLTGLSQAQIQALIVHELAHIRRHDYFVGLAQSIFETALFFHPAVWWVSRQIRREREHCCDDLAVQIGGDRLAYAKALTFLEQRRSAPAFAPGANGGNLKMRVARLLGMEEAPALSQAVAVTLLSLAAVAAGCAIVASARAQSATPTQQAAGHRTVADPYGGLFNQWLHQDVRWIITPEEREAFLRLTNDEERTAFIRQFWERRNPSPGSSQNTFREEHYRRIAYANMHFAEKDQPGWQTGRGHVYIVFGAPDAIDAHPQPAAGATPSSEAWSYRTIRITEPATQNPNGDGVAAQTKTLNNVAFRFVDTCGCGEYRLQTPFPQ
jgi:GWxTD domain-containing protein